MTESEELAYELGQRAVRSRYSERLLSNSDTDSKN